MAVSQYLPSSKFVVTVVSFGVASSLIYSAYAFTAPPQSTAQLESTAPATATDDWQVMLDEIQAESAFAALPEPLSAETVASFLDEAQTSNLTETIGRTLLVNLSNAKSQGLGDDIPTQEQIILNATTAFPAPARAKTYTTQDIVLAPDSPAAKKAYGNGVMQVLKAHPGASASVTLSAMARATDNNSPKELEALTYVESEYAAIVNELALVPVPQTLAPLHLQLLNSLGIITATFTDMRVVLTDPLRGTAGAPALPTDLGRDGAHVHNHRTTIQ